MQLQDMAEVDKVFFFIEGLQKRTKAEVGYRQPQTLNEAISLQGTIAASSLALGINQYQWKSMQPSFKSGEEAFQAGDKPLLTVTRSAV
jgi:hypothetical protein